MAKFQLVISDHAAEAFAAAFVQAREASLVGAESLRAAWVNRLHKLASDPRVDSRLEDGAQLPGQLRSAAVKSFRIFFLVQSSRVVVLDVVLAGEAQLRSSAST